NVQCVLFSNDTVDNLKDLIKTKKAPRFDDVSADELKLWRVNVPVIAADKHIAIVLNEIESKTELVLTDNLSDVFEEKPPKKTIHIIVQRAPPGDLRVDIKKVADKFFAAGSKHAKFLERFVHGTRVGRTIVDIIQRCGPGNVPIFGISGCGKPRGMIELLSRQWGFYYNASGEDLGSDGMTTFLAQVGSRLGKDRDANNRAARTMTYLLFLSRLLILQFFLRVDSAQSFTAARWTLLQACPHMFMDVFEELFRKLLPLHQRSVDEELALIDVVSKAFQDTRTCLIKHGGAPEVLDDTKLFVVHDEAQILGEKHFGRFESLTGTKVDRLLLSPILYGFQNIEGESELAILTSGTGLSIYILNWARSSGSILKHVPARSITWSFRDGLIVSL
ncbi:hypothetical protein BG011_009994, partial [Mortierella polycephala]